MHKICKRQIYTLIIIYDFEDRIELILYLCMFIKDFKYQSYIL